MTTPALIGIQIEVRRADIRLAAALGTALALDPFDRTVAEDVKAAFLSARVAGNTIRRTIAQGEAPGTVIHLADRRGCGR